MEIRKVQKTGGASYIISLPKDWVKASKIEKNDPLGLISQPDGSLTITPHIHGKVAERVKIIDLKDIYDCEYLYRLLIAAYVTGFNTIKITTPSRIPSFAHKAVRMFIQASIGQEVSEETEKSMTIKDLLNPGEMPFENVISRMHVIIEGMLNDAIYALKTKDRELAEDVIFRDRDVNKLYWLISRQYNLLLRNVSLSHEMGMNVETALHYMQIARVIERTGDQVVQIAENVRSMIFLSTEKKTSEIFQNLAAEAMEIFKAGVDSFCNRNVTQSQRIYERIGKYYRHCDESSKQLIDSAGGQTAGIISIAYIIDNLKKIGEYTGVICESAINYGIMTQDPDPNADHAADAETDEGTNAAPRADSVNRRD